jgi:hypothetical protein
MVLYQIPSLDPELTVAVGWESVLASFVGRVEGVPTGMSPDPNRPTVTWFGSRQGELRAVQDLQEAIGEYAVLGSDIRMALEADRNCRADELLSPPGTGQLRLVGPQHSFTAEGQGSADPAIGRALLDLALMIGVLLLVLALALFAIITGAANL